MENNLVELKVEGMDCNNCAASITRFLERKGLEDVYVNFQTKEVRFRFGKADFPIEKVKEGIHKLGYTVVEEGQNQPWWTLERKVILGAVFTTPLLLHHLLMVVGVHMPFMDNFWFQMLICLPVFITGVLHFGRSAWSSLRTGVPNMDVLIFTGSTAAFIYSFIGTVLQEADYIFYETSAMIITLVLVGNWLEKRAVSQTTSAIGELAKLQVEKARKVMPSGAVVVIEKDDIRKGDILQVNEGDKIPADGVILSGKATIDESMLTGESMPVEKHEGDEVIGASLLASGNLTMEVVAAGRDTVLSRMIELVKTAQENKPDIQRLADRISAVFVPVVLVIALGTLLVGHFGFGLLFQKALMNAIAVLVISCPCAMGLATPTAVMVGVGRMARNGILVKGGQTLEIFSQIKNFVFDKTGTLTTGNFRINAIEYHTDDHKKVNSLIYHLEKYSSHPIARSLVQEMADRANGAELGDLKVEEHKGVGVVAADGKGNVFKIGSGRILKEPDRSNGRRIYLTENDRLLATVEISDQIKPEAKKAIDYLRDRNLNPVILSGDRSDKTREVAGELGVKTFYAEKLPAEKLEIIGRLSQEAPTAMVGDGINDAPALAKATLGVSLSNASQAAIQSAQIVLLNGNLDHLPKAIAISRHTVITIKQNLFWAFAYNIVAIPIAAMGFLNPMWGALFMAFSDVVVIGNSIRLKTKRIS
jgi:P-type Cu+ transporter